VNCLKKKIIAICIVAFILLCPIVLKTKDGGTVEYRAVLYCVQDVHRFASIEDQENGKEYDEGIIIEILGFEVFNNVK